MRKFLTLSFRHRYKLFFILLGVFLAMDVLKPSGLSLFARFIQMSILLGGGINLLRMHKKSKNAVIALSVVALSLMVVFPVNVYTGIILSLVIMIILMILMTSMMHMIMTRKYVDLDVLLTGLSLFILLGILAADIFMQIEIFRPNSFNNLTNNKAADLFYFSFVTLLTVGYGDIAPLTFYAKKVTIFFALIGHFYSVVIMAIIISKYISNKEK